MSLPHPNGSTAQEGQHANHAERHEHASDQPLSPRALLSHASSLPAPPEPAPAAGLGRGAGPALKQPTIAITCRTAVDVLLRARGAHADAPVEHAALAVHASTAAGLGQRASAAHQLAAAAIAGRTAVDLLIGARIWYASTRVREAALAGHSTASAGLGSGARAAIEFVAASVVRRTAGDALLRTGSRLAGEAPTPEAVAPATEIESPASAELRRNAGSAAEEQTTAAIGGVAALVTEGGAGGRHADACVGRLGGTIHRALRVGVLPTVEGRWFYTTAGDRVAVA